MYSSQLLDHFQHPRNAGEVPDADISVQRENPVCGDVLKLTMKIVDGRIQQICFQAKGCVPTMACGSVLTELVCGKTLEETRSLRREDVVAAIGGLPEASGHAAYLAIETLAAALQAQKTGSTRK